MWTTPIFLCAPLWGVRGKVDNAAKGRETPAGKGCKQCPFIEEVVQKQTEVVHTNRQYRHFEHPCHKRWISAEKCGILKSMNEYRTLLYEGETGKKFARFYQLLCAANEKFNLTAITGREECDVKHFLDSLAGERFFPQGAQCAEVGSGGGFPSVPLMIVRADLRFDLFESSEKKCNFLREVAAELGLPARVHALRAEDAGKGEFRARFDVCCARAVARMNTLAEYCVPLVRRGGRFIAYKGRAEEELAEAENAFRTLGVRLVGAHSFLLSEEAGIRTVCVLEKYKDTPAAYPRGRGKERSRPL